MSSLAQLEELPDISYHTSWDTVKQALQNWSVRDKFTYRTPCKDDRRARYICTQPNCYFRVTGNKDRSGRITLKVVNREHTCARRSGQANAPSKDFEHNNVDIDATLFNQDENEADGGDDGQASKNSGKDPRYRNPATQMKWLVSALEGVLEVTIETKPHDIQTAAKQYFNEEISYQQAFRCLRLLTADIKEHGHRERVPDEIRKAIITLRVFVDPPMDWSEIERKTGVKARTAGYIFSSAEKKSGGSKDPFVLLKNATISASGPKAAEKPVAPPRKAAELHQIQSVPSIPSQPMVIPQFSSTRVVTPKNFLGQPVHQEMHLKKKRKSDAQLDPNVDPSLDITLELARAAAQIDEQDDLGHGNSMLGMHSSMSQPIL